MELAERYQDPGRILRAFDLVEWVDATGGAALFRFTPKGTRV